MFIFSLFSHGEDIINKDVYLKISEEIDKNDIILFSDYDHGFISPSYLFFNFVEKYLDENSNFNDKLKLGILLERPKLYFKIIEKYSIKNDANLIIKDLFLRNKESVAMILFEYITPYYLYKLKKVEKKSKNRNIKIKYIFPENNITDLEMENYLFKLKTRLNIKEKIIKYFNSYREREINITKEIESFANLNRGYKILGLYGGAHTRKGDLKSIYNIFLKRYPEMKSIVEDLTRDIVIYDTFTENIIKNNTNKIFTFDYKPKKNDSKEIFYYGKEKNDVDAYFLIDDKIYNNKSDYLYQNSLVLTKSIYNLIYYTISDYFKNRDKYKILIKNPKILENKYKEIYYYKTGKPFSGKKDKMISFNEFYKIYTKQFINKKDLDRNKLVDIIQILSKLTPDVEECINNNAPLDEVFEKAKECAYIKNLIYQLFWGDFFEKSKAQMELKKITRMKFREFDEWLEWYTFEY